MSEILKKSTKTAKDGGLSVQVAGPPSSGVYRMEDITINCLAVQARPLGITGGFLPQLPVNTSRATDISFYQAPWKPD
ncbi:hypothetical protein RRG08_020026 [Elysia crispata]|uniref:Uncharacterized protein n=1 Tax=Elysia crispata TaxID=231223 RepID=A0AAE1BB89_9GAST|nr:hypothetical protein RRG08_020026 [Elysia crispata]